MQQQLCGTLNQSAYTLNQSAGTLHQSAGVCLQPNQLQHPYLQLTSHHPKFQQSQTCRGVSPECVSVISAHSTVGQFCRVLINTEPVIVPREYLNVNTSGQLTCSISGLEFPIKSYEEVTLEQGPQPSEPDSISSSDLSLVVLSPETSSGLTLEDDKTYTVLAGGARYRVSGRDIVRAGGDSEAYLLEVDGQLFEVSDIEEDDIEEDDGTDVEDSVYSVLAPEVSSGGPQPELEYQVILNGSRVTVPGKSLYPTELPGKFLVSLEGETGIVSNPLPLNNNVPFLQHGTQPITVKCPFSFQETNPITCDPRQRGPATTIDTCTPNITVGKSPTKQQGACSPSSVSSGPRQGLPEEYITKLEHLATSSTPRKATFASPAAYLAQVIPTVQRKPKQAAPSQTSAPSQNKKQVHFSTVSSPKGSTPDNVLPTLPGLEMLGEKAMTVEEMHLEAFISPPGEGTPDHTLPDKTKEPEPCLQILPGIVSLHERVQAELEVAAAQSSVLEIEDSSSSDGEVEDKAEKLCSLPGLEALSALAVKDALNFTTADCEDDITDTDLFDSESLKFRSGRFRNNTGSSANTIQQIDEMMSMNSSLGENGSGPIRALSAEEPTVDFYRVLIEGTWYTAKSSELSSKDGETYMTMIDKSKRRVESVVKVPGVDSPTSLVFLCDDKKYSISYLGRVITVSGSDIKTCERGQEGFLVPIDGVMTRIKRHHITELVAPPKQFASLKSMVAVKLSGVWKIIPSEKLAPSAKNEGNYYVKRNGEVIIIPPSAVYPMFKQLDLPLGSNSVPEKYVTKLEDRLVKVPIRMFSVYKMHDDKIVITYKNKKHVVKLTALEPFIEKPSSPAVKCKTPSSPPAVKCEEVLDEDLSLTNTSTFSASEYKDNLYCIRLGSGVVNVPGRLIKPHKRRQGFCKIKYRSKIFRVRADKVKLARQSVPLQRTNVAVFNNYSSTSPHLKSVSKETSPIGINVQVHSATETAQSSQFKPKTQVRFPKFDELLKTIPREIPESLNPRDSPKGARKVKLSLKLDRPSISVSPEKVSRTKIPESRHTNKKRVPIKLDVIPVNKLRLKKDQQQLLSSNRRGKTIPYVLEENPQKDFEITNIRSSPIPEETSNLANFEITNIRSSPVLRNDASPADSPLSSERRTCVVRPHQNKVYIGCEVPYRGISRDVCSILPCSTPPSLLSIPTVTALPPPSAEPKFSPHTQTQAGVNGRPKSAPSHSSSRNLGDQSYDGTSVNKCEIYDKQFGLFNVTGNISLRKHRALSDKVGIIDSNLFRKV